MARPSVDHAPPVLAFRGDSSEYTHTICCPPQPTLTCPSLVKVPPLARTPSPSRPGTPPFLGAPSANDDLEHRHTLTPERTSRGRPFPVATTIAAAPPAAARPTTLSAMQLQVTFRTTPLSCLS